MKATPRIFGCQVSGAEWREMPFVEISCGDLVDRITILRIKLSRLKPGAAMRHVERELACLEEAQAGLEPFAGLDELRGRLEALNSTLWDLEDDIRRLAAEADFGDRFVRVAQAICVTNDARAAAKRQINVLTNSRLVEEKVYAGGGATARPHRPPEDGFPLGENAPA